MQVVPALSTDEPSYLFWGAWRVWCQEKWQKLICSEDTGVCFCIYLELFSTTAIHLNAGKDLTWEFRNCVYSAVWNTCSNETA